MASAPAPSASISANGSFWAPSRTRPLEPTQIAPDFSTTGNKAAASRLVMGSLAVPRATRFETTTRFTGPVPPELTLAHLTDIHQDGSRSPFQRNGTKFGRRMLELNCPPQIKFATSAECSKSPAISPLARKMTQLRSWFRRSFVIKQMREPLPHVARFVEMAGHARRAPGHGQCEAAQIRHDSEYRFVGDVTADKNRTAALQSFVGI